MKKKLFFVFALLVLGVSALGGAENASAISAYDDILIESTAPYKVRYQNINSGSYESTFELGQFLGSLTSSDIQSRGQSFCGSTVDSLTSGQIQIAIQGIGSGELEYWITPIQSSNYNSEESIIITVNNNPQAPATYDWYSSGYLYANSSTSSLMSFGLMARSNGYVGICPYSYGVSSVNLATRGTNMRLAETNSQFTYPVDYGGWQPVAISPPAETVDYVPDFYVSTSVSWLASIHDQNFNTFDGNPFLCGGEFAPILHYEIWDRSSEPEVKLFEAYNSATVQIDYQFEKKMTSNDYRVVGWYECGGEGEFEFSDSSYKDFTITATGGLYTVGLETCLQEGFPFFSFDSCTAGINDMLALLSFNALNPSNQSILGVATTANPNNCHQLGTLGEWINKEGTSICPAFPAEIRNIITPFVTFVLGGLVFYYISRGRGVIIE